MNKEEFIEYALQYNLIEHIDYEYYIIPSEQLKIMINSNYGNTKYKYYYYTKKNIFNHIEKCINKLIIMPYLNMFLCIKSDENRILNKRKLKIRKLKNG